MLVTWQAQVLRVGRTHGRTSGGEAIRRIDAIFAIERTINGLPTEQRRAVRQARLVSLVADLETWMRSVRGKMSRHSDIAKAMDYTLERWGDVQSFPR